MQKAVQETQRLILQVWTPVPTSIPQDKAIKRNQGCTAQHLEITTSTDSELPHFQACSRVLLVLLCTCMWGYAFPCQMCVPVFHLSVNHIRFTWLQIIVKLCFCFFSSFCFSCSSSNLVRLCVFSCVFLLDDESLRLCHCRRQCRRHKG